MEIADDSSLDTPNDNINRARLKIDVRKWIASKLLPKVYGERGAEINVSNAIHNHFHVSEDVLQRLQERRAQLLEA
jgi:hypothetical protein